jgi:hypothetical protein
VQTSPLIIYFSISFVKHVELSLYNFSIDSLDWFLDFGNRPLFSLLFPFGTLLWGLWTYLLLFGRVPFTMGFIIYAFWPLRFRVYLFYTTTFIQTLLKIIKSWLLLIYIFLMRFINFRRILVLAYRIVTFLLLILLILMALLALWDLLWGFYPINLPDSLTLLVFSVSLNDYLMGFDNSIWVLYSALN